MIKILVVDDERWVRKSIIGKANWEKLDAQVVGEASNGFEALNRISELNPDIVITDMRMPKMDGIELINTIRYTYPQVKLIVISGYSDFKYTKQALKNKVEDYILKPIDEDELTKSIEKVIKDIYEDKEEKTMLMGLKYKVNQNRTMLREVFLNKLVFDPFMTDEIVTKACSNYELNMNFSYFSVSVFKIVSSKKILHCLSKEGNDAVDLRMLAYINHILEDKNIVFFRNFTQELEYICIMGFNAENVESRIINEITKIKDTFETKLDISCMVGIGNKYSHWENIRTSYIEACKASRYVDTSHPKRIILFHEIITKQIKYSPLQLNEETKTILFFNVKSGFFKEIKRLTEEIFVLIQNNKLVNLDYIYLSCVDLLLSFEAELHKNNLTLKEISPKDILSFQNSQHYNSIDSIKKWLEQTLCDVARYYVVNSKNNPKSIVLQAREYIIMNYQYKISLKKIAHIFHINEVYFSKLFKNEIGQNFIDFLTSVRMEKAKDYLVNSSMKISHIASSVGYDDQRHFSKLFKKYYNVLPSEMRNRQKLPNQ